MRTKINNFYNLLNNLRHNFQQILNFDYENFNDRITDIELLYRENKNLFPFEIKTIFEDLYAENPDNMKMLFWDNLKYSYYNLKDFIELDYQFFKNPNFTFSDNFKNIFYHSKNLSYNYFTYLSRIYYWYYGRYENKKNENIRVNYLSDFEIENIEEIKNYYSHQFEIIEKEIKYIYAKNNFTLDIAEPKYTDKQELNSELENLNTEHFSKLEILKDYSNNITKMALDLRFDYPDFITDSTVRITFSKPQEVYDCIEPYLSSIILREELKNLIFGEIDIASNKIRINCNQNVFAKFFGELNAKGIIYANNNDDIEEWILRNFQHKKNGQFKNFAKSSVNTFMKPYRGVPESEAIKHPF